MELRNQLAVLRGSARLIATTILLAVAAALVVSYLMPRVYEGRVTLIVGQSLSAANPNLEALQASQRLSQTYADVATTRPILEKVVAALGLGLTADELGRSVQAVAPRDTSLLTLSVRYTDADQAARIANEIANQLIAASPTIQGQLTDVQSFIEQDMERIQAEIERVQVRITELAGIENPTPAQTQESQVLRAQLSSLRQTFAALLDYSSTSAVNRLTVVEPAVAASHPASPQIGLNVALAGLLGLALGVGLAFAREHLDDTIKSADELRSLLDLPVLGTVPRIQGDRRRPEIYRLVTLLQPRSPAAETFRVVRTSVEFASVDEPIRTLLVTSALPGEGKSMIATNMAVVFAQAGRRVCLVDADLRAPTVHMLFRLKNTVGLSTMLLFESTTFAEASQPTEVRDLRVITTGPLPPNPAELLASRRMRSLIERLREEADLIIFDSSPLQAVTDAAVLGRLVDGTVLVVDSGRTRRTAVRHSLDTLHRVGARVIGTVLNRPRRDDGAQPYYGGYGVNESDAGMTADRPAVHGA